jgi:hypothetical protein
VICAAPDAKLRRNGGADALSYFSLVDTGRRQENTTAMNRRMAAIAPMSRRHRWNRSSASGDENRVMTRTRLKRDTSAIPAVELYDSAVN